MFFWLFLLFAAVPILELAVLVQVGTALGVLPTIGICLLTAFVGASLARREGIEVARRAQDSLQRGQLPTRELQDGLLILMAGLVLLTPGFVTDALGLLLLFPPSRAVFRHLLLRRLEFRLQPDGAGGFRASTQWHAEEAFRYGPGAGPQRPDDGAEELGPDQEIYRPGHGPRRPPRRPPRVIDADE